MTSSALGTWNNVYWMPYFTQHSNYLRYSLERFQALFSPGKLIVYIQVTTHYKVNTFFILQFNPMKCYSKGWDEMLTMIDPKVLLPTSIANRYIVKSVPICQCSVGSCILYVERREWRGSSKPCIYDKMTDATRLWIKGRLLFHWFLTSSIWWSPL